MAPTSNVAPPGVVYLVHPKTLASMVEEGKIEMAKGPTVEWGVPLIVTENVKETPGRMIPLPADFLSIKYAWGQD